MIEKIEKLMAHSGYKLSYKTSNDEHTLLEFLSEISIYVDIYPDCIVLIISKDGIDNIWELKHNYYPRIPKIVKEFL